MDGSGPHGPRDPHVLGFEPATVLPSQLIIPIALDASIMPEKRLLLAVLEDAVLTFQRHARDEGRRGQRLFREANQWISSNDATWPCSFRSICESLGFEPAYVRNGLRLWCDQQEASGSALAVPRRGPFRRSSGSRTRAVGRPVGLGRRRRGRPAV
jgi:hypothetical protein